MPNVTDAIQAFYEKHTKQENDDLVSSVGLLSGQALSGEEFFPEVLQNSDDAYVLSENRSANAVRLTFTQNYLVISHDGKAFDANDITTLCKVANKASSKRKNEEVTGNKGVGFKALFNVTDTILIVSHNDQFAFDKHHEFWRGKTDLYPWMLAPILKSSSDIPVEVRPYMPNTAVSFALKINAAKRPSVLATVTKFLSHPENILFFRRIKSIQLSVLDSKLKYGVSKTILENDGDGPLKSRTYNIELNVAGVKTVQKWLHYTVRTEVPEDMTRAVANMDCVVQKYKDAQSLKFHYAIRVEGSTLQLADNNKIYVTLPTDIKNQFKFLINAEFLLDLPRTNLLKTAAIWNRFILTTLYDQQFKVLKKLTSTSYWQVVPSLISHPAQSELIADLNIQDSVMQGFTNNLASICMLKTLKSGMLIAIKNSELDPFEFRERYADDDIKSDTVHTAYNPQKPILTALGSIERTIPDMVKDLKLPSLHAAIKTPAKNKEFIAFLMKVYRGMDDGQRKPFLKDISTIPLFLNANDELSTLNELNLPGKVLNSDDINGFFEIVHPELAVKKTIYTALSELGVKELDMSQAIFQANKRKPSELMAFTNMLIEIQDAFTETDWQVLYQLKFVNREDKPKLIDELYLRTEFEPTFDLDAVLDDYPDVLHLDYDQTAAGKKFFSKLPVQTTLTSKNICNVVAFANAKQEINVPLMRALFTDFYLASSVEFKNNLAGACQELHCQTGADQYDSINQCYLSDQYQPNMQLQKYKLDFKFISPDYLEEDDDVDQWRAFFLTLGAEESIKITCIPEQYYINPLDLICKKYFAFLYSGKNEEGTAYCVPACKSEKYDKQHKILNLYHMPFLPIILKTPLFWQALVNDWDKVKKTNSKYYTYLATMPVPNAMMYYAKLACQESYKKDPAQLYAPLIHSRLGDLAADLACADIAAILNEEQQALMGFKVWLTARDCYRLLGKIREQEMNASMLTALGFIYESLLQHEPDPDLIPEDLKLLATDNAFKPANTVHLLTESDLQSIFTWTQLLKIPQIIMSRNLQQLAQHLGIKAVTRRELKCYTDEKVEKRDIHDTLIGKAVILALLAANHNQADITPETMVDFIKQWLTDFNEKLKSFKFIEVSGLWLDYLKLTRKSITSWKINNTIYAVPSQSSQAKMQFMHLLDQHFEFNLSAEILCDVIELDLEALRANHIILNATNFSLVQTECVAVIPRLPTPKRKNAESSEDEDSSSQSKRGRKTPPIESSTSEQSKPWEPQYKHSRYTEVGWVGEEYVFALKKHEFNQKLTQEKYAEAKLEDDSEHGILTLTYGTRKKVLQWFNFKAENKNTNHYDLIQTTYHNDTLIKQTFIEVKASEKPGPEFEGYFSPEEMAVMTDWKRLTKPNLKQNYRLFCVFKVNDPSERGHIMMKDPNGDKRVGRLKMLVKV